eukprot:5113664-Amphidinium_carterae.1
MTSSADQHKLLTPPPASDRLDCREVHACVEALCGLSIVCRFGAATISDEPRLNMNLAAAAHLARQRLCGCAWIISQVQDLGKENAFWQLGGFLFCICLAQDETILLAAHTNLFRAGGKGAAILAPRRRAGGKRTNS